MRNKKNTFIYKKSAGITALSASFKDFTYKNHAHEEYAIGVTLRGVQQYHLAGSLQLSYPNGVMFFNPEQAHDGKAYDEIGLDYVMLYIEPKLLLEATNKKEVVLFEKPIVYDEIIKKSILNLSKMILNKTDDALCSELFLAVTDNLVEGDFNYKSDPVLIKKAKNLIQSNIETVLKIEDVSTELNLSKFQFIRFFKQHTGISPYQYFINCKIEYAKRLIEKDKDIYAAVTSCGYTDLSHLNKHFKSVYGATAFEYISQLN